MSHPAVRRLATLVMALTLAASLLPVSVGAQSRPYADPAFQQVWERYDRPVEVSFTKRSWTWGPHSPFNGYEPYKEAKDDQGRSGRRIVQYFDKTRMEINDPNGDRDTPFFVTNGLLVRELVAGRIALGHTATEAREAADEAVAGDPASLNEDAATYTSFREVASLNSDRRADNRMGEPVTATINKAGRVRSSLPEDVEHLGDLAHIAVYETTLGHNIPDRFWNFLNQEGMVYEDGQYHQNETVYQPWVYAMGVPITEPYWTTTRVGGDNRWVLVQLFERRVLTYTPGNPAGFEVEMGNVGQHYYRWRYDVPDEEDDTDARPRILELERTDLTATSARIEWETSRSTTGRLEYGTTDDYGTRVGSTQEYDTEHAVTLTGLTPNTVYHYRIISRDRDGRMVDDDDHTFKTESVAAPPTNPPPAALPAAPTSLTAMSPVKGQVTLRWADRATNETVFWIERSTAPTTGFVAVATLGANVTSYTQTGLPHHETYYYRVRAANTAGASAYSNMAKVRVK